MKVSLDPFPSTSFSPHLMSMPNACSGFVETNKKAVHRLNDYLVSTLFLSHDITFSLSVESSAVHLLHLPSSSIVHVFRPKALPLSCHILTNLLHTYFAFPLPRNNNHPAYSSTQHSLLPTTQRSTIVNEDVCLIVLPI